MEPTAETERIQSTSGAGQQAKRRVRMGASRGKKEWRRFAVCESGAKVGDRSAEMRSRRNGPEGWVIRQGS
jgi:hypothetical protein